MLDFTYEAQSNQPSYYLEYQKLPYTYEKACQFRLSNKIAYMNRVQTVTPQAWRFCNRVFETKHRAGQCKTPIWKVIQQPTICKLGVSSGKLVRLHNRMVRKPDT